MCSRLGLFVLLLLLDCNYLTSGNESDFSSESAIDISSENLKTTCHHEDVTRYLNWIATKYFNIARLVSIGNSTQGRELWAIIISENSDDRPLLKPQVKFVGNINGFSGPSCVVLIKFIKFLVENYELDSELRHLVDKAEIHILPNMNPDGYAKSLPGECYKDDGRQNANGVDLNRNFPDMFRPHDDNEDDPPLEKETIALTSWIHKNNFILSASFISGAQVVSYPYDTVRDGHLKGLPHETPDMEAFRYLAKNYVGFVNEQDNNTDWYCPSLKRQFQGGIINGAEWHSVSGTMMDFNYNHGVFEILVGLSCCRNENNPENLEHIWRVHKFAMISMIREAEYSFRGQVIDSETSQPMGNVEITTVPHDKFRDENSPPMPFFTNARGEFWRVLLPGSYILTAFAKDYLEKPEPFVISMDGPPLEIRLEMESKGKRRRQRKQQQNAVFKPQPVPPTSHNNLLPSHPDLGAPDEPDDSARFFYDYHQEFLNINRLVNRQHSNFSDIPDSVFHELAAVHRASTADHSGQAPSIVPLPRFAIAFIPILAFR